MEKFYQLLFKQLENLFFLSEEEKTIIEKYKKQTDERFLYNCSKLKNKYYAEVEKLSPFHSCQYTMFLYFLSNTIFKHEGINTLSDKIYNLLKIVSSADIYYEIELPGIFMFDHPMGTVLGRAKYGNYFSFSQCCTVGNNKGIYPSFGNNVMLMGHTKVLGNSNIGDFVVVSANTYIKDIDIPSYSIVFGGLNGKDSLIIKPLNKEKAEEYFKAIYKRGE